MFPRPIESTARTTQAAYKTLLPIALLMWLAPLLAVAVFSIKPDADFTTGNYWGIPSTFEGLTNYGKSFSKATCRATS